MVYNSDLCRLISERLTMYYVAFSNKVNSDFQFILLLFLNSLTHSPSVKFGSRVFVNRLTWFSRVVSQTEWTCSWWRSAVRHCWHERELMHRSCHCLMTSQTCYHYSSSDPYTSKPSKTRKSLIGIKNLAITVLPDTWVGDLKSSLTLTSLLFLSSASGSWPELAEEPGRWECTLICNWRARSSTASATSRQKGEKSRKMEQGTK